MSENGTHRCWDHEDCPHRWCDGELQQQDRFNVMCLECELVWTHVRYPPTHTEPPKDQLTDADGEVWAEKRAVATDGGQDARVGSVRIRCDGGETGTGSDSDSDRTCVHCNGPGTHKHNHTGVFLCCGHASWDVDAEPVRDEHDCVTWHRAERFDRDMECEISDNPNPPTGDLVPCHEPAKWAITTSRFPGDPHDPDQPGAPTRTKYCYRHFGERFTEILESGDELDVRYNLDNERFGGGA